MLLEGSQHRLVSEALFYFAFSLPFAGVNLLLIRAFFSLQRPWVPTTVALVNLGLNAALDAVLYKPIGIGGIPLSTAIVSMFTTVALAAVLRPSLGGIDERRTLGAAGRIVLASAVLAGVTFGVSEAVGSVVADSFGGQLLRVAAAGLAGMAAYAALVLALRVGEARQLLGLVRGQLARLRQDRA